MPSDESPQPPAAAAAEVVTERRGTALVVRINRPQARNAFNKAVMAGIGTALLAADADPGVRVVVLTAAHAELQLSVFGSADAKEGALAFVERRDPVWKER